MTDSDPDRPEPILEQRRRELALLCAVPVAGLLIAAGAGVLPLGSAFLIISFIAIGGALIEQWRQPVWRELLKPQPRPAPPVVVQGEEGLGQKARALLDELPDSILVLDGEGRLVLANRAACSRFVGEAYERKFLSSTMRRPTVLEAVQRVRESAKAEEVEFSDLVPLERSFAAYVAPLQSVKATPAPEILVVVRDVTAAKAVEKMRADFVANASHELRTPLSSLIGFIDTLRGHARDDTEARERFLEIMADQAGRMGRLIDDLLSLSRIELNEHVAPQGKVDLGGVVRDVLDAMQPLARDARITLSAEIADGLTPVTGMRDELVQVLQNLLDNAIKYGRADSKIEVVAALGVPSGITGLLVPSCYLSVTDRGEGIAREHIPRLTERFYRIDVKRSRERGGTGLGLAIVKHIVSRHRGKLHIKSEPGLGSVFTVILPLAPVVVAPLPAMDAALAQPAAFTAPADVVKTL